MSIIQRMGLQCGVVKSYEAVYGLYDLDSVGWQLHVAEFDGVKTCILTYYPKDGSAVLVWSSYSELQS